MGTHAGGYVALIAAGRYRDAWALARGPNPFASVCGRVCAHPCEAACRRGRLDAPLQIRALKRFAAERCGLESRASFEEILAVVERPRQPAERPGRVAVVGAGPAGLACAHDLALMGHGVTVYDAAPVPGGMMRLGIPDYRLPRDVLSGEIEFIRRLGVELRMGVEIGRDVRFEDLCAEHDAVFLAPGCRRARSLPLPGAELPGVTTALDFLAHVNLGRQVEVGQRVVVVGGGSVAFDAGRAAWRLGGDDRPPNPRLATDAAGVAARVLRREVTLVALESAEELPADPRDVQEGAEEGVAVFHRRGPQAILGEDRVRGLRTIDVARVFDDEGRFSPAYLPGTDKEIACDTVILAIGQATDLSFLGDGHGLDLARGGFVKVDPDTRETTRPGVYAGGDAAFGPRIVIEAVADGRRAARAIDTRITGRSDAPPRLVVRVLDSFGYHHPFARGDYEKVPRRSPPLVPVEGRTRHAEVERTLPEPEARAEGSRCLHCWVNTVFDASAMEGTECIQCGGCVDVCPEHCIDLVRLARIRLDGDGGGALRLPDGSPLTVPAGGAGAALLKDETACIRCGLCARRCPVGLITMQTFHRADEAARLRGADEVL